MQLLHNTDNLRLVQSKQLRGDEYGLLFAVTVLLMKYDIHPYKKLIQKPVFLAFTGKDVKETELAVSTACHKMLTYRFNAWHVLFVTNTNGLDVEGLREMTNKHFLVTITWGNIIANIYLQSIEVEKITNPVITVAQWPTRKVFLDNEGRSKARISPTLSPIIKYSVPLSIRVTIAEHFFSNLLSHYIILKYIHWILHFTSFDRINLKSL